MQYSASIAPAQHAQLRSLVRICILRRILRRYSETLHAFFIQRIAAHDQTVQVHRLGLSNAGHICHHTHFCMRRTEQCFFYEWKENCVLIKYQHTICFDDEEINS